MLNPDGVILGNYRTGIAGRDLNRVYIAPNKKLHPTIHNLKQLIHTLKVERKREVFAYFDLHGHSKKKGVFMYGSPFPLGSKMYYQVRVIPKLLHDLTDMFR